VNPAFCPRCGTELGERRVEGRDRKWCGDCERPIFRNAAPCADVTVVDGDRVLLVERAVPPDPGAWTIPGGHLEFEEEPRVGAARELREEAGLSVEPAALALTEAAQLEPFGEKRVVSVAYAVDVAETTGNVAAGSDAAAVEWVPQEALPTRNLRPQVERRVEKAVRDVRE
jgi:8-oxo-dGTP diphosphatase